MLKKYLTIIIVFLAVNVRAQSPDYNSDAYWANFHLQQAGQPLPAMEAGDTCLVFVTNRHLDAGKQHFVDEYVDTAALKYLFLQKRGETWKVFQVDSLTAAMRLLPEKRDIVIYAEGMGKIFTMNVERALLMRSQYHVNVVMFDYASINTTYKPSRNFRFARANARLSAPGYEQLLKQVQTARIAHENWSNGIQITAFFHSMGNIILRQMMLHQQYAMLNAHPFLDNVVINAACVPQRHHRSWVEQIRYGKHVYIHYNQSDWQLKGAHFLTFAPQLGEKAKQPRAKNAVYIDFRDQARRQHSYFLNFPRNDYRMTAAMKDYFSELFNGSGAEAPPMLSNKTISSIQSPANVHPDTRPQ